MTDISKKEGFGFFALPEFYQLMTLNHNWLISHLLAISKNLVSSKQFEWWLVTRFNWRWWWRAGGSPEIWRYHWSELFRLKPFQIISTEFNVREQQIIRRITSSMLCFCEHFRNWFQLKKQCSFLQTLITTMICGKRACRVIYTSFSGYILQGISAPPPPTRSHLK